MGFFQSGLWTYLENKLESIFIIQTEWLYLLYKLNNLKTRNYDKGIRNRI